MKNKLSLKALIFLLNISTNKDIANLLAEKQLVSKLTALIFEIMKTIKNSHLKIKVSFLQKDSEQTPEMEVF